MKKILILALLTALAAFQDYQQAFKEKQMTYPHVKMAYIDAEKVLEHELEQKNIFTLGNQLYLRAFKREQEVEVWIRPLAAPTFTLLKTYKICANSGDVGPKMDKSDQKIPEGFYSINRFSPEDTYFLAMGLDYPNKADILRGAQVANVEFRGGCKAAGNLPMTDAFIKDLYVLALEAYTTGQNQIPVHIFPTRMGGEAFTKLTKEYSSNLERLRFWNNIKTAYDYFELTHKLLTIEQGESGYYLFKYDGVPVVSNTGPIAVGSLNDAEVPATPQPTVPATPQPSMRTSTGATHIVAAGETLYGLAKQYRHSVYMLKKWNKLASDDISVGQALQVAPPDSYEVKKGDTMYSIANRHGLTINQLKQLNNKRNDILKLGEKLVVKQ